MVEKAIAVGLNTEHVNIADGIIKILNLLYYAFVYSLLILLSSIYQFMQCHSLLVTVIRQLLTIYQGVHITYFNG